jgi:hypothetical protein
MTNAEKREDFSALAVQSDVAAPSVQECHDEKRSSRDDGLGSPSTPASGGEYDGQAAPLTERTTTHDLSECCNVEPEPSLVDNNTAPVQTRPSLPSFAQSEFYTVNILPPPLFRVMLLRTRARADPSFRTDRPPSAPQARGQQPQDDRFALSRSPVKCRVGVLRNFTHSFRLHLSSFCF